MIDEIYNAIVDKQNLSDNKCGTSETYLREFTGIKKEELRIILNKLFKQEMITVRKGVNGNLIFLK
jgi:DNA-binding IscR family transcriptional regulator